ncbi:MAG TPA: Fe2+-dependent dioxygenase [Rhizomicrobium sp.]|jgi:PKHD-type hydroxylase|nr:Fe2+-dependent dioxygenase [Rhizomicrobium sp.]
MLIHLPKILGTDQLAACRTLMGADAPWADGRGSAGGAAGAVKRNRELTQPSAVSEKLGGIVIQAMMASPAFQSAALPVRFSPPSFSRYEASQAYGPHSDAAVMEFRVADSRVLVRTDLAATLFLSEPADYAGGELVIEDTFGQSRVKLPAGDMVLYPASSLHHVAPVTQGVRLVSFLWIQSLVRDDFHRSMLRDLDITLQGLNRSAPGSPAGARLLNLYHNLLRLWSET